MEAEGKWFLRRISQTHWGARVKGNKNETLRAIIRKILVLGHVLRREIIKNSDILEDQC